MNHRDNMFDQLSQVIESAGKDDPNYDNFKKAEDILDVLEGLLAYTIYTTCESTDHVRDACEESYINIKRQALRLMYKELEDEKLGSPSPSVQ